MEKKYVFIGGLHRSGTSTLRKVIGTSNLVSIHRNTKVPEDEGQHIQSVYGASGKFGGPGSFGFNKTYHYTEKSNLLTQKNNDKILNEWSKYWDLNKSILLEKSPPNIIHTRYLQELVPNSYFIIIIRHPFAVAMATKKWNKQSINIHIEHWLHTHEILYNDLKKIKNYLILRYENLNIDTFENKISNFLGENLIIDSEAMQNFNSMQLSNKKYFDNIVPDNIKNKYENRINEFGYTFEKPFVLSHNIDFKSDHLKCRTDKVKNHLLKRPQPENKNLVFRLNI